MAFSQWTPRVATGGSFSAVGASSNGRNLALFVLAAVVLAGLSRAALHDVVQHDPPFFAEVARLWRAGALPYVGSFDVKPPGLFALFVLAQDTLGDTYLSVQVLQILAEVAVAVALRSIGVRMGAATAGNFAGLMYIVCASFTVLNNVGYAPFVALTAFGVRATLDFEGQSLRPVWLAGLLLGLAFTMKQTVVIPGFAMFCLLVAAPAATNRRLHVAGLYIAAAASPALAFCTYFAAHGALRPMLEQTVLAAVLRSGGGPEQTSYVEGLLYFFFKGMVALPVLCLAAVAIAKRNEVERSSPSARVAVLAWWLTAEIAAVLLQKTALRQYFSPVLAPSLLLAGMLALMDIAQRESNRTATRCAALVLACVMTAPTRFTAIFRDDNPTLARINAEINQRRRVGDHLLVMNDALWLYAMTGLHPAGPIFNPMHLYCEFPGAGEDAMRDMIVSRPRFVVVRRAFAQDVGCATAARWETFEEGMQALYSVHEIFVATEGYYELFVRIDDEQRAETVDLR